MDANSTCERCGAPFRAAGREQLCDVCYLGWDLIAQQTILVNKSLRRSKPVVPVPDLHPSADPIAPDAEP